MTAARISSISAVLLAVVALVIGATRLASADFGTALRARHCDASPLGGLSLLLVGGTLIAVAAVLQVRIARPSLRMHFDLAALAWALPVPLLLLAGTLPGVLGCRAAQHFQDVVVLGDSLIGMSGAMLAASAATLVGVAFGVAWRTETVLVHGGHHEDLTTSVIEQAIADAHDPHAGRFRGVDG
jgi:hypothetical protein